MLVILENVSARLATEGSLDKAHLEGMLEFSVSLLISAATGRKKMCCFLPMKQQVYRTKTAL